MLWASGLGSPAWCASGPRPGAAAPPPGRARQLGIRSRQEPATATGAWH